MATALSVNVNKLALLRNSRGRNYPDLAIFGERMLQAGVHGLTVHPRPDERHVKFADLPVLAALTARYPGREFNIEGYPSEHFLQQVIAVKPHQCTLVPDAANQLTSDHGWDLKQQGRELREVISRLQQHGIRISLFLDPDPTQAALAKSFGADRIELYTEGYAHAFGTSSHDKVLVQYRLAAERAQADGVGVNAGHDLDLRNLPAFLSIPHILEVSIGHALTVECIEQGMQSVLVQYLQICGGGH